jgi:hypothetical protein
LRNSVSVLLRHYELDRLGKLARRDTARRKTQELAKEEMEKLARDMGVPPGLLSRGPMGA